MSKNVFGEELIPCSFEPMTGFYRNGCCVTGDQDVGTHTVCAEMTEEFLIFTKIQGNDLITPRPEYQFPGLKPGDKWCLCALRWKEAYVAGFAPPVLLEATNEATLRLIPMEWLLAKALRG
jgi:uncharacterized protein